MEECSTLKIYLNLTKFFYDLIYLLQSFTLITYLYLLFFIFYVQIALGVMLCTFRNGQVITDSLELCQIPQRLLVRLHQVLSFPIMFKFNITSRTHTCFQKMLLCKVDNIIDFTGLWLYYNVWSSSQNRKWKWGMQLIGQSGCVYCTTTSFIGRKI